MVDRSDAVAFMGGTNDIRMGRRTDDILNDLRQVAETSSRHGAAANGTSSSSTCAAPSMDDWMTKRRGACAAALPAASSGAVRRLRHVVGIVRGRQLVCIGSPAAELLHRLLPEDPLGGMRSMSALVRWSVPGSHPTPVPVALAVAAILDRDHICQPSASRSRCLPDAASKQLHEALREALRGSGADRASAAAARVVARQMLDARAPSFLRGCRLRFSYHCFVHRAERMHTSPDLHLCVAPRPLRAAQAADGPSMAGIDDEEATATEQFMQVVDEAARAQQQAPPKYAVNAWIFLHRDSFPRRQCIWICEQAWFNSFILILIGVNCITMVVRARLAARGRASRYYVAPCACVVGRPGGRLRRHQRASLRACIALPGRGTLHFRLGTLPSCASR